MFCKVSLSKIAAARGFLTALAIAGFAALPVHIASAQDHDHDHEHEMRSHGPHVHGVGTLNVALEKDEVEIELVSPGHDLVGFEHAPGNDEEKAKVADAVSSLRDGTRMFVFPAAAGCHVKEAEVETGAATEDKDEHDHGHEHQHEHEHEHEHEHGGQHSEFHAHYHFQCGAPSKVTHVDVGLFQRFPGIQKLNVQVVSSAGQSAHVLEPDAARLNF